MSFLAELTKIEKNPSISRIFQKNNFIISFSLKFDLQVKDVEDQLSQRKAEVEKLIQEMREVNMESLAISPPEESKQFLDGNIIFQIFAPFFPPIKYYQIILT